jgi:hypothetical protein
LPPDQRTRIGVIGQFNKLSEDAAAGVRAWDPQARIVLRIGPLDRATFERLLPDRLALQRLVSLVRAYVGFEIGFAINPVLAADSVPPLRLDAAADPPPRLGWNTWVETPVLEASELETLAPEASGLGAARLEAVGLRTAGPYASRRRRLRDADDSVFEAEVIEAQPPAIEPRTPVNEPAHFAAGIHSRGKGMTSEANSLPAKEKVA